MSTYGNIKIEKGEVKFTATIDGDTVPVHITLCDSGKVTITVNGDKHTIDTKCAFMFGDNLWHEVDDRFLTVCYGANVVIDVCHELSTLVGRERLSICVYDSIDDRSLRYIEYPKRKSFLSDIAQYHTRVFT